MSSWARDVLSRLFSTKSRSRATSDTTSSKTRLATTKEEQQATRRSSLATAAAFLRNGSRSGPNDTSGTSTTHRRADSQPVSVPSKGIRLGHARSKTQVDPITRLRDREALLTEHDDGHIQVATFSSVVAEHIQAATQHALSHVDEATFLAHDPTIDWEPPTWEDLWKEPARSMRTYSNSRLSSFAWTPKKINDSSESRGRFGRRTRSVSRKSSFGDLRSSAQPQHESSSSDTEILLKGGVPATRSQRVKRSSLQKELPALPQASSENPATLPSSYLQENAARNARILRSLQDDGILDLTDTEDTHTAVIWSPAVTHEKRVIQPIEVIQHAVSRDVHNHHIINRVLPVVDLQVLPARHFMPDGRGGYVEISEEDIPGGKPDRLDELIAGAISKSPIKHEGGMSPPKLSSRPREDKSRRREHVSQEGNLQTEQWWLHAPEITMPLPPHHTQLDVALTERVSSQKPQFVQQTVPDHAAIGLAGVRAQHRSFQYRTPDGLPSWTAITTETELPPQSAAHAPVAAAASEKVATPQGRPQAIHTILPIHVAHGNASTAL
ncbi:hypothetical protein Slin15195_G107230 [Septoria linicola]|uniref:Uncharacterized protein n=1 Tax=Septoria linicola TaxID=215465 RepID=A0A9Q9EP86_9PEZI|nr:hypothetical protein Slin14017_G070180 [Septoria linicola]USW57404.1 hypothetical protein Slin15195_G107230 [Septoria linicola]